LRKKENERMKELEKALEVFGKLSFSEQQEWLERFRGVAAGSVAERRRQLEAELRELQAFEGAATKPVVRSAFAGKKLPAKYRSKKDPTRGWAGRGEMPRWLREEMAASKKDLEFYRVDE
jgi:DNA-binding protein H-NS